MKKSVLLHTCCAPCTTQVHFELMCQGYSVAGFFYNPNIYPEEEYQKRKDAMDRYSSIMDFSMVYVENDLEHKSGNCHVCYEIRLLRTAQFAKNRNFNCFTTTLLISPYQKHDLIKTIGEKISKHVGVEFLYMDLRQNFNKSRDLAVMYELYRQKYCGCLNSIKTKGGSK